MSTPTPTITCLPSCAGHRINSTKCVCAIVVARGRTEEEACQRGTVGCSINHSAAPALNCETW